MPPLTCPSCKKTDARKLYACRHCKARVCFACAIVKKCCGVVPPGYAPRKGARS